MKGIVFTLDALFSLMLITVGISIIIYFIYNVPTPSFIQFTASSSFVNELASTKLNQLGGINLVQAIVNQSNASTQTWPQRLRDPYNTGGNNYGPSLYTVAYTYTVPENINNGSIVAGYGNVYFGAGNVIYALNASSGTLLWTSPTPYNAIYTSSCGACLYTPSANYTILYDGKLIYWTEANTVALNAYNGSSSWSTYTPYKQPGSDPLGEPDSDEASENFIFYNNRLITGTYDESGDTAGYPLYALYANNGTYVGGSTSTTFKQSASPQTFASYLAISQGDIIAEDLSGNLYLLTQIYNGTYAAGQILTLAASAGCPCSNIATSGNTIGVGNGNDGDIYSISGAKTDYNINNNGDNTGLSSFDGRYIFQSLGPEVMYAYTYQTGGTQWYWKVAPTISGTTGIYNATPIQSSQNVYTIWGNRYVSMQNVSTGTFLQNVQIPLGGNINPYMALAYGKLFASIGNHLVAFGTCQADGNLSLLAALGTMYINNQGSCADYILNSLQNSENLTFGVNIISGQALIQPIITVPTFTSATTNVLIPYSSQLSISTPFTVSLWFNSSLKASSAPNWYIMDNPGGANPFYLELVGGISPGIRAHVGTSSSLYSFSYPANTWENVVAAFTGASCNIYLNGNLIANACSSGSLQTAKTSLQLGGSYTGSSPFIGQLSNLQIYSGALAATQAGQIYRDGLTGPPVPGSNTLIAWFPLAGDANGYGSQDIPGFAAGITFRDTNYTPTSFANSHSITSQSNPVILVNYSNAQSGQNPVYGSYTAGVYSWR